MYNFSLKFDISNIMIRFKLCFMWSFTIEIHKCVLVLLLCYFVSNWLHRCFNRRKKILICAPHNTTQHNMLGAYFFFQKTFCFLSREELNSFWKYFTQTTYKLSISILYWLNSTVMSFLKMLITFLNTIITYY